MGIDFYFRCIYNDKAGIIDLELEGDENVLIYRNEYGDGEELINILSSIRIMITTELTIYNDKYRKLPKNIEYVIVEGKIYDVREEFEMMNFMKKESFKEYIEEEMRKGRINESNKNGETLLLMACYRRMEEEAMELIPRMTEDGISKWNKKGETALIWACYRKMKKVALNLIPRMTEDGINKWDNKGDTAIMHVCYVLEMEEVVLNLIPRMSEEAINKWNNYGETALIRACKYKNERIAKELIPRMSEEAINKWDNFGITAKFFMSKW